MAPRKTGDVDFKRIKAKVGKRVKSAMLTDTTFRSAKLAVGGNSLGSARSSSTLLLTKRGKSLVELSHQLEHPAMNVRLSACKGINDIISNADSRVLAPHWNFIIPALGRCSVDEDADVRQAGIQLWTSVFNVLKDAKPSIVLRPYRDLLVALVSSGLNSLDKSTRVHGVSLVLLLCTHLAEVLGPRVPQLLAAYTRLFRDFGVGNRAPFLQSLVALLKIAEAYSSVMAGVNSDDYPVSFKPNFSRTVMASQRMPTVRSLSSTHSIEAFGSTVNLSNKHDSKVGQVLLDFLTNFLVEATQNDDIPSLALVSRALRLLVSHLQHTLDGGKLIPIIMDSFPQHRESDQLQIDQVNGDLCIIVTKLAPATGKKDWASKIASYVKDNLRCSTAALDAWQVLMMNEICIDESGRTQLASALRKDFFAKEDDEIRKTVVGRKAAHLAHDHIYYQMQRRREVPTDRAIIVGLGHYLVAWGIDFPSDSQRIVQLITTALARSEHCKTLVKLQTILQPILEPKGTLITSRCTFQAYPPLLQHSYLCLLVRLVSPKAPTLKLLGRICATNRVDRAHVDWTNSCVSILFAARKKVQMPPFLSFLIDSTGIFYVHESILVNGVKPEEIAFATMMQFDDGIAVAAKLLTSAGPPSKVLGMIEPCLRVSLSKPTETSTLSPNRELLLTRFGLSVLASFSFELRIFDVSDILSSSTRSLIEAAVIRILCQFPDVDHGSNGTFCHTITDTWIRPIIALLSNEPGLLLVAFATIESGIRQETCRRSRKRLLQGVLYVLQDERMTLSIKRNDEMRPKAKSLHQSLVADEQLSPIACRILGRVETCLDEVLC